MPRHLRSLLHQGLGLGVEGLALCCFASDLKPMDFRQKIHGGKDSVR